MAGQSRDGKCRRLRRIPPCVGYCSTGPASSGREISEFVNPAGSILLFIDDDVRIPNRRFIRHSGTPRIFFRDKNVSCIAGRELHVDQLAAAAASDDADLPGNPSEEKTVRLERSTSDTCKRYVSTARRRTASRSSRSARATVQYGAANSFGSAGLTRISPAIRMATITISPFDLPRRGARLIYDPQAVLIHLQAPAGGLRLKDRRNTFSERDKAISTCLFVMRHRGEKGMLAGTLTYHHLLRKTVLLKRNVLCFWRQPYVWFGLYARRGEKPGRRMRAGPRLDLPIQTGGQVGRTSTSCPVAAGTQ